MQITEIVDIEGEVIDIVGRIARWRAWVVWSLLYHFGADILHFDDAVWCGLIFLTKICQILKTKKKKKFLFSFTNLTHHKKKDKTEEKSKCHKHIIIVYEKIVTVLNFLFSAIYFIYSTNQKAQKHHNQTGNTVEQLAGCQKKAMTRKGFWFVVGDDSMVRNVPCIREQTKLYPTYQHVKIKTT